MKYVFPLFCVLTFAFISPTSKLAANPLSVLNRLEGQIFDENRAPIGGLYVELLNDVESMVATQRSTSLGRFTFTGLSAGIFKVKVLPSGRNLLEQTKEIQFIASLRGSVNDVQFVEFYMRADKRSGGDIFTAGYPEAIFVQEIPETARKLYKSGVESLDRNQQKGLGELDEAIKILPNYFDALSRLGKEYILRKDYEKGYPYLLRAIDQNPRSYSSFYALAFAFLQLNQVPAALSAARACTVIRADDIESRILYGQLLRMNGDFSESEQELKKALAATKKPKPEIHWQLALLYNRLNRNKAAADQLELFLKLSPPETANKKEIRDLIAKLREAKTT